MPLQNNSLTINKDKAFYCVLVALFSFSLSLLRLHFNINFNLEIFGVFFIAVIFDPWLASFTGLLLIILQGLLLEQTYLYLLILYAGIGLYWGYMLRLGAVRIWGGCEIRQRIKNWVIFLLFFLLGGSFIEISIKETLNELVFKDEGLIYYREGLTRFWANYVYHGKFFRLLFNWVNWHFYLEMGLIILFAYLLYRFYPSKNRYLLASTKISKDDLLVEQNSIVLYIIGLSVSMVALYMVEISNPSDFKLVDLIHTASFWEIFFTVLSAVVYFIGTREKFQNYVSSIMVIIIPPSLMLWMVLRIQNQINIRTSYKLKHLVNSVGITFEKINELITTQFYQQMLLTALITISYILGSFIIILIIFKWNKDLREAKYALEDQVIERTRRLQQAQEALIENEKLVSIGRLSAEVAHEINNPLYGVLNYCDILLAKVKNISEISNYIQSIRSGLYYISAILKQLRGISGPTLPNFSKVNIVKLIDHSLFLMEYKFNSKNIEIIKQYADAPILIDADPQQMQQVFINIIHNAVQTMQEHKKFTIAVAVGQDQTIKISFIDEGAGIPDTDLKNIFQPFFTTKKPEEGVGLGLTICDRIIKNHHGEIKVDSIEGKGATFVIRLPVSQRFT